MGGRISAFHFRLGQEHRLAEAIYKMPAPSMLVAWEGTKGGNFDGQTIWKHRWGIYYRMGNAAGVADPVGYEDLWWITCNRPPGGTRAEHPRICSFIPAWTSWTRRASITNWMKT